MKVSNAHKGMENATLQATTSHFLYGAFLISPPTSLVCVHLCPPVLEEILIPSLHSSFATSLRPSNPPTRRETSDRSIDHCILYRWFIYFRSLRPLRCYIPQDPQERQGTHRPHLRIVGTDRNHHKSTDCVFASSTRLSKNP